MTIVDRQFFRKSFKINEKQASRHHMSCGHWSSALGGLISQSSQGVFIPARATSGIVDRQFRHKPLELGAKLELEHG